jgi:neutral ceramidase
MIVGTSQREITPAPGGELSGFAARVQPSTGALDPLFAKALFLCDGAERLLWIHCDLIGLERGLVGSFRAWAKEHLGLRSDQVLLSATHTHSGPATLQLNEAGAYDPGYAAFLEPRLREAAEAAMAEGEPCELAAAEGRLELAVDRRHSGAGHTDPRVGGVGFRRADGTFVALVINYAMHAVALGSSNRLISADVPGQAARALMERLPGRPMVLATNGACGNLNPPRENVSPAQVQAWGEQMAEAVGPQLVAAPAERSARLRVRSRVVPLPVQALSAEGIESAAAQALRNPKPLAEWGDKYRRAVEQWRRSVLAEVSQGRDCSHRDAELFAVGLGDVVLLGANAEVFSEFTELVRRACRQRLYLVGYANGDIGYLPTRKAYAEGGYEVEVAHFFYNSFAPGIGGLERLAEAAAELVRELSDGPAQIFSPGR